MKKATKILALTMCFVMLLGILAGCGGKDDTSSSTTPTKDHSVPEIIGTVMLNVNACVDISFDAEGRVLNLLEVDSDAYELLSEYAGYLESSCAEVVKELVELSIDKELLTSDFNNIIIMQRPGAQLPSESFLTDLAAEAEKAADISVNVTVITAADLDEEGNIGADMAYDLLLNTLNVDSFDFFEASEEPIDGTYAYVVSAGAQYGEYLVDIATGYVYEGTVSEFNPVLDETEATAEEGEVSSETEASQTVEDEVLPEETAADIPESPADTED